MKSALPACLVLILLGAFPVAAKEPAANGILLELFTSQGCYSCPPAEALVRDKYASAEGVIALEYHVDYWDDLVYGSAGKWEDPFSDSAYTKRQTLYNIRLRDTRGVFTPQMIVHGRYQSGGSNESRIDSHVAEAKKTPPAVDIFIEGQAEKGYTSQIAGRLNGGETLNYAIYWLQETTVIPSGENKGKTLSSRHIVKRTERINAGKRRLSLPAIDPTREGCAVWVQRSDNGPVLAAARCPTN